MSSSSAYNLIGTGGSGGLIDGVAGNRIGVADPGLATGLADSGGPTKTIALLSGSPAINAGSNVLAVDPTTGQPLTTDERGPGFPRIVNKTADIGAFEFQPIPPANTQLVVTTQPSMSVTAGTSFGLSVTAKDSSGNVDTSFDNTVTVALLSNPGGATLGGTLSVAAVDGVAAFSALTLDQLGDGYTLRLSSDGLTSVTTNSFGVIPSTPVIPPTGSKCRSIIGLQYIGAKHNLILTFSEPMDATRAQVAASYRLVWAGKDHRLGTSDDRVMPIRSAPI